MLLNIRKTTKPLKIGKIDGLEEIEITVVGKNKAQALGLDIEDDEQSEKSPSNDIKITKSSNTKTHIIKSKKFKPQPIKTTKTRDHMIVNVKLKPHKCDLCDFRGNHSCDIKRHMRIHMGVKAYKCETCDYASGSLNHFETHMRTHTGEKPYLCQYCSYASSQSSHLKTHMRSHTGEKPYKCEYCSYSCVRSDYLKSHLKTHNRNKQDQAFSYNIYSSDNHNVNKDTPVVEKPFKCDYCGYACARLDYLKKHIKTHYKGRSDPQDYYNYTNPPVDPNVNKTHHVEKPYKCDYCNYQCARLKYLKCHLRTHVEEEQHKEDEPENMADDHDVYEDTSFHNDDDDDEYVPSGYTNEELVDNDVEESNKNKVSKDHTKSSVTNKKNHKCSICNYTSSEALPFKTHMMTHTDKSRKQNNQEYVTIKNKAYILTPIKYKGRVKKNKTIKSKKHKTVKIKNSEKEKRFKCNFCSFEAHFKCDLRRHLTIHSGEKPFKCDHCDYACAQSNHFETHMRIHTGEKPFECTYCDFKSAQSNHLKTHIRTHTGEKPYQCEYCDYACARLDYLKKHLKTHDKGRSNLQDNLTSEPSDHVNTKKRTQSNEKIYKCEHCEYTCSRLDYLKKHLKIHDNEIPIPQESNHFSNTPADYSQMRPLDTQHPYKCEYCAFSSPQFEELKEHLKTHYNRWRPEQHVSYNYNYSNTPTNYINTYMSWQM